MATPTTDHLHERCYEDHSRSALSLPASHCVECGERIPTELEQRAAALLALLASDPANPTTCEHPGAAGIGWPEAAEMYCTSCGIRVRSPRAGESPVLPSGLTAMWIADPAGIR